MKIQVSRVIVDFDGEPILDDGQKPTELRQLIHTALNHTQKGLSPAESVERYRAMQRVALEDEPDLSIEMLGVIKEGLARCFVPKIAGQAILMIEGG